jgi:hypothetical protein
MVPIWVRELVLYLKSSKGDVTAAYIAFVGTIFTLIFMAFLQIYNDGKARRLALLTARTSLYAEIRRTKLTTQGNIDFVEFDKDGRNGMIWIVIYPTLYPSADSLARINKLTAREVRAITSFYFVYKETIGFLKASALEILPLIDKAGPFGRRKRRAPHFDLDMDMLEYVYKNQVVHEERRKNLLNRLKIIEDQSQKALLSIAKAVSHRWPFWRSELATLISEDTDKDATSRTNRRAELMQIEGKLKA